MASSRPPNYSIKPVRADSPIREGLPRPVPPVDAGPVNPRNPTPLPCSKPTTARGRRLPVAIWAAVGAVILGVWVTVKRGPVEGLVAALIGAPLVAGLVLLERGLKVFTATRSRYRPVNWFKKALAFLLLD